MIDKATGIEGLIEHNGVTYKVSGITPAALSVFRTAVFNTQIEIIRSAPLTEEERSIDRRALYEEYAKGDGGQFNAVYLLYSGFTKNEKLFGVLLAELLRKHNPDLKQAAVIELVKENYKGCHDAVFPTKPLDSTDQTATGTVAKKPEEENQPSPIGPTSTNQP